MSTLPILTELPSLPCKPPLNVQFSFKNQNGEFYLRSLEPVMDIPIIDQWVRAPYAGRFWRFDLGLEKLRAHYQYVLDSQRSHSFIGMMGMVPVCLIDVYGVSESELGSFISEVQPGDTGIHLLMAPPRQIRKGWSALALRTFAGYFFECSPAGTLYAEPDRDNLPAIRLAESTGFFPVKSVRLKEKTALLMQLRKSSFVTSTNL